MIFSDIVDEIRLFFMRKQPTFAEIVDDDDNPKVDLLLRVAMNRAGRKQNRLLKKAKKVK